MKKLKDILGEIFPIKLTTKKRKSINNTSRTHNDKT